MVLDAQGRVQVYIRVSVIADDVLDGLQSLGVVVERQDDSGTLVQARVPVKALPQVAELEFVTAVTLPNYGHVNVGSKLTEGDALLDFNNLRATLGVDGSGITVGVISDGIFGLSDAIASGDLPNTSLNRDGAGKLVSTSGGVIATSFRADGDLEGGFGGSPGAEGTAILEIVHDIAPSAQLRFANFDTDLEFIAAVDFLAANSDVVIDDIGFFGKPDDQTSNVSANTAVELNRSSNPIRGYYTAVGNDALRHYQETYVDSGTDGTPLVGIPGSFHQFAATSDTTDCFSLGPNLANVLRVGPGQTAVVFLTWDDTFGGATTDFDLFIFENGTDSLVAFSVGDNPAIGDPVEAVAFTNNGATSKFFDIRIQNFQNASAAKTFDMFVTSGGIGLACSAGTILNYNTLSSSVAVHGDAGGGVVSVGAIDASDPGIDDIESFSSRGPTNNGVTKPDVSAIDGVSITGSGGFGAPFFGTSAAAPHVAALLLDLIPGLLAGEEGDDPAADRAALRAAILDTAVDLGDSGLDNTFGSGRVNGLSAGQSLVELVSIAVTPDSPSIANGLTQQFTATGTFTDTTTQDLTASATWSSSNTAVATIVSTTGLATAVGVGTTTITATSEGVSGSTVLTVTAAQLQSIAVTPANPSLAEGQTQQFTATGTFTDDTTQDLTTTAAWTSSNTAVATIIGSTGLATAVSEGTTVITATSAGVQGSTALIVGEAALQLMAVTPETPSIAKGLSLQFTATGTFTDDSSLDLTTAATWTSSNRSVATITASGLAAALGEGATTITATSAGVPDSTVLTVTPIELVSIAVTPDSPSKAEGLTQQFTATGTFTDSTTQDLTATAAWISSTTTVATISSTGLATAVGQGTTTVTADTAITPSSPTAMGRRWNWRPIIAVTPRSRMRYATSSTAWG